MRKLTAIKQRLDKATDPSTNTDEKLENGAISDFVAYGDSDIAWLLARVVEMSRAGGKVLRSLDNSGRTPYIDGLVELRAAIRETLIAEETEEGKGKGN